MVLGPAEQGFGESWLIQMALDSRVIKAPKDFTGRDEEWNSFKFKLRNYLTLLDVDYDSLLDSSEASELEIRQDALGETAKKLSVQLYALLAQLCQDRALKLVKKVKDRCGFEVWRLLHTRYEPKVDGRFMGMLSSILNPGFTTLDRFEDELNDWEEEIEAYESQSGEEVSDAIRKALVIEHSPEPLQDHLTLNGSVYGSYQAVKDAIVQYMLAKRKWQDKKVYTTAWCWTCANGC